MIVWDDRYEIGIGSIDAQHQELIRITGELSDLLMQAKEEDDIYDEMVEIIEKLKNYTVYHFQYEEDLFEQFEYQFKDDHKLEHEKLISIIENLDLMAVDEEQVIYGKKILKFLIEWVFKHIVGSDFMYKEYMVVNGVS